MKIQFGKTICGPGAGGLLVRQLFQVLMPVPSLAVDVVCGVAEAVAEAGAERNIEK